MGNNDINLEKYLSSKIIKHNWEYLFNSYENEYNIPIHVLFKKWCNIKKKVINNLQNRDDLNILDISGHSLYSPLAVFEGRYKSYSLMNCNKRDKDIQQNFFNEQGNDFNINYVDNIQKDKYDLILDWQGEIIFNKQFILKHYLRLMQMLKASKEYVIFEGPKGFDIKLTKDNVKLFEKLSLREDKIIYFNLEKLLKKYYKLVYNIYDNGVDEYMWLIGK